MTTPDYGSVLEDLKAKRAHLDVLIAGLELVAKDAATVERGGAPPCRPLRPSR